MEGITKVCGWIIGLGVIVPTFALGCMAWEDVGFSLLQQTEESSYETPAITTPNPDSDNDGGGNVNPSYLDKYDGQIL